MSKDSKKEISVSNFIKLGLICLVTILVVLFLRNWYLKGKNLEKGIPVLSNVLTHQIKANELYDFVHDADTAVVYMCVSSDENCRSLEMDMKRFIQKNSLEDVIIYLDLSSVADISKYYEDMRVHYQYDQSLEEYPSMIYFEDASIQKVLSGKDIDVDKIEEFLKGIQLIV